MSFRKIRSISSFAVLKVFHETSTTFVTTPCWQVTQPAKPRLVVRLSKRLQKPLICCRVQVGFKQEKNAKLRQGSFLLPDARSCGQQVTRRTIRKKTIRSEFLFSKHHFGLWTLKRAIPKAQVPRPIIEVNTWEEFLMP